MPEEKFTTTQIELLWRIYDVEYIYENEDKLILRVTLKSKYPRDFIFKKVDWYINITFALNSLIRNLETLLYWNEVKSCWLEDEERLAVYYKYWRKWSLVN